MAITVNFFNADWLPINVNVNNSLTPFQIGPAGPPGWNPQVPAANPAFNPGPPTPGNLGIGTNYVQLTPASSIAPFVAQIDLPDTVNWSAIQIYIFYQTMVSCSWLVLNAGQIISHTTAYFTASLASLARKPVESPAPQKKIS